MATETNKTEAGELRNWPIFFTHSDRVRIAERAASKRRTAEQEVLAMLEAAEALEQDIDAGMRTRIDEVKRGEG